MRTLRLWLLFWLLPLISPMAWAQAGNAVLPADPPCPMHQAIAAAEAADLVAPPVVVQLPDRLLATVSKRQPTRHLPCGDCSACHAVALLPPAWQLDDPDLVEATPGWHADLGQGRPEGCELYRPPRA
jgi:hypothetical protein